jgi:hypothetical protein
MTPEELNRMSENVHTILNNRGIKIPLNDLKVAYA